MLSLGSISDLLKRSPRQRNAANDVAPERRDQPNINPADISIDATSGDESSLNKQSPLDHSGSPTSESTASALEALPAELRNQILSSVADIGVEELRALVRASPVFHEHYRLDRKALLSRALKSSLGNQLVDAYAVHTSVSLPTRRRKNISLEDLSLYMDKYHSLRNLSPDQLLSEINMDEADAIAMASFHLSIICPVVEQCAVLFLQHLDPSLHLDSLSWTKRARLLRALYRFELCRNLLRYVCGEDYEILDVFFCKLHPWEIEEIDCICSL
ncbi:uncharacterized protein B0T15DRAFT_83226 [Chaetomium strumarium]|uniref:F-box domain-containing protein n=1 Tax=Chaetomium strumarium TaxID=1170767 RepID=A0AAJ0H4L6_9PEZI|nr:hypothetical protein B0T15DRAFT_83226 [Chaetomium strumarium]